MKALLGSIFALLVFAASPALLDAAETDTTANISDSLARADWAKTIDLVGQYERQLPRPVADWLLGYANLASQNYREATEHFMRLDSAQKLTDLLEFGAAFTSHEPTSAIAQMMNGDALARVRHYPESLRALDLAVNLDSSSVLILNTRGAIRVLNGDTTGGQEDFVKALALAPSTANTYANLGLVQMASGHFPAAVDDFTRAIQLAPEFGLAHNGRAAALAALHQWDTSASGFVEAGSYMSVSYATSNAELLTKYRNAPTLRELSPVSGSVQNGVDLGGKAYEQHRTEIGDHLSMDVFIIRATPETATFEGMKTVVQDIVQRLRDENHLTANQPLRLQIDGSAFNSSPIDRMRFAALMAQGARRDAVILMDFSSWFASPETVMWPEQVEKAADQLGRVAAAIHLVTGQKPTLNGYSGVSEAFVKLGERLERGELPKPVRDNLAFESVVLAAYPFRDGGVLRDVTVQRGLLQRVNGNIVNFYSDAFANNRLAATAKVSNVRATDASGAAIQHMNFNDIALPDGSQNPVLMMGGRFLRGGGTVSGSVNKPEAPSTSLPALRGAADNLDRLSGAITLLHELTQIDIPLKVSAPLALGGSVLRDIESARNSRINPLTSNTLEALGRFGLDELPSLVDKLIEKGKLPASYRDLLKAPVFAGLPDFVAAASQQVGRRTVAPSYEEVSLYAEGLFKVTGAVIGAYSRYPNGPAIGTTAAGLLSDTVKGASQSVGRDMVRRDAAPRLLAEWNTQIESSIARNVPAKSFSEMYGFENLTAIGYDPRSITERDNFVHWLNAAAIVQKGVQAPPTLERFFQTSIPSFVPRANPDDIARTLPQRNRSDDLASPSPSVSCPPYCGPPHPPARCISCGPPPPPPPSAKCTNCGPPPPPPSAKCTNCGPPPPPPPSSSAAQQPPAQPIAGARVQTPPPQTQRPRAPEDRGGVTATATVVVSTKDAPANLGAFFPGAHSVDINLPDAFFTPFLQFCAPEGARWR